MDPLTPPLGSVVAAALKDAGISEKAAADLTTIPRTTLKRHLVDGDFRHSHLRKLATLLDTTPSALSAAAEEMEA